MNVIQLRLFHGSCGIEVFVEQACNLAVVAVAAAFKHGIVFNALSSTPNLINKG